MSDINRRIERAKRQRQRGLGYHAEELRRKQFNIAEQKLKDKNNKTKVVRSTMGRRETFAERQRRLNRNVRKDETSPKPGVIPNFEVVTTPSWFANTKPCDVSIIVPMFRSKAFIQKQIRDWDLVDDGLRKEIIYVDDCCPQRSYEDVLVEWEKRRQFLRANPIGKLIRSNTNRGYAEACNLGAKHALGDFLIFLNADVVVSPNWVKPMFDLIKNDPTIGIVGNLQFDGRTTENIVNSAGSEWVWRSGSFEHIGRSAYKGQRLERTMHLNTIPTDLLVPAEREMVTGCCFMIPKKVFHEIGGYDELYKIGYWEDADMCMSVRELNYKIYYQPDSRIYHTGGHSKAGGHPYQAENKRRFYRRWVDTGVMDHAAVHKRPENRGKPKRLITLKQSVSGEVVGCIIACNEEEFLAASVESVLSLVSRFVFVIGGNDYARQVGMCNDKGYPNDNTLDIARELAKKYNGVVIEPPGRCWANKCEMRNAYTNHLYDGNWMFMLDGDEVYKPGQLWTLAELMAKHQCLHMQYYVFWNNVETIGTGSWENYPQERMVKWRTGYKYHGHNHLNVAASDGKNIAFRVPTYRGKDKLFYHYSWVRPLKKIEQKLQYYKTQLKQEWGNGLPGAETYVKDVFLKWRESPGKVGNTHPRGGGGAVPFAGIHPYEVARLIEQGKLNF